jgi:predicted ester cyclase
LEGVKQFFSTLLAAFPDAHFQIEDQIAEGEKVATRWTARGTHQGHLQGIAPTSRPITVTGITILRIANQKIVESWGNSNTLGIMQQFGVLPSME